MLKFLTAFFLIVFLTACAEKPVYNELSSNSGDNQERQSLDSKDVSVKKTSKYLAYIHTLAVELEKEKLASVHKAITNACDEDIKYECAILNDDYTSGEYSSGRIQLRVKPEGVKFFSSLASLEGEVATQSRKAEDLGASIIDNAKRIQQLERFEKKLIALESRTDADIDSLLKVASQLSETQTQLEYLEGSRVVLLQRVQTDILNINLRRLDETSFFGSIGDAFEDFGEEFIYAIEGLVNAIAYIIPWALFLMIMFFILRAIFRFLNLKVFRGRKDR